MDERVASKIKSQSKKPWIIQNFFLKSKDPKAIIFLDRDDTLIKDFGNKTHKKLPKMNLSFINELSILADKLNQRILFVVVTNQSKIFKKETTVFELKIFHLILVIYCRVHGVRIQRIVTCPHIASQNCECRKPKPTTILDTINDFNCKSIPRFMIGNNITDIQAGLNASCYTIGISGKVKKSISSERNKLFLGYFTLESSFTSDILNKIVDN